MLCSSAALNGPVCSSPGNISSRRRFAGLFGDAYRATLCSIQRAPRARCAESEHESPPARESDRLGAAAGEHGSRSSELESRESEQDQHHGD